MSDKEQNGPGFIQIHKKVLNEIVYSAVNEVEGVTFSRKSWINGALIRMGIGQYSGITIKSNKQQDVSVEVRIYIKYGLNIPIVAKRVQESIKSGMEKTVDVNLKEIDVNIQGIERGA